MPLEPLVPVDTRHLFRPVSAALVALLRDLPEEHWRRPTLAGSWQVCDVVAHLLDSTLRRLSFHRDGLPVPPPPRPIASPRDFVAFINELNGQWVAAMKRVSPRALTDLYAAAASEAADWFESLPLDAPALFPVSWAGEDASAGWFDVGREFTELWHHQQQVRIAVGADSLADPRYLRAVVDVALRALPHAFRDVRADAGVTVVIDIDGPAGGRWTLAGEESSWRLFRGEPPAPTGRLRLTDDAAWKILFNAMPDADAAAAIEAEGPGAFRDSFIRARSVIV
jgi:uncharacterized protein (TIGR03083 family)